MATNMIVNKIRNIILFFSIFFIFTNAYSAYYDSYYGAIAINSYTGATGYSYDYSSRNSAENAALAYCDGNCVVAVWFANQCGAVSWSPSTNSYGRGTSRSSYSAESTAHGYCGQDDCEIVASVCTTWYEEY